ncbi:hypothetical protein B0T19DRAFT_201639 [Cercophora scortea]|uniref:Uncharacterized protein n=1 Tax=Cercophora scortea TaxID=314031 RepID=A0AAE0IDZ3_9PEZI|nr:hypothetical protein B0T19DRAFT_201639 [Cercophora scortea]
MPLGNDVTSVLALARSVVHLCRGPPYEFQLGADAANEVVKELEEFQQLSTSSQQPNAPNHESSLTGHLSPCVRALERILDIRQKYGRNKEALGFREGLKWKSDKERFDRETSALHQATIPLRETVKLLQRTIAVSPTGNVPVAMGYRQPLSRADTVQSFSSQVSLSQTISVTPQSSQGSQTSFAPSIASSAGPKAQKQMCPRGSGCRQPYCHQRFDHPNAKECANGRNCSVEGCLLWHPKSPICPTGPSCAVPGCVKAHPWPRVAPPPAYQPSNTSTNPWQPAVQVVQKVQVEQRQELYGGQRSAELYGGGGRPGELYGGGRSGGSFSSASSSQGACEFGPSVLLGCIRSPTAANIVNQHRVHRRFRARGDLAALDTTAAVQTGIRRRSSVGTGVRVRKERHARFIIRRRSLHRKLASMLLSYRRGSIGGSC